MSETFIEIFYWFAAIAMSLVGFAFVAILADVDELIDKIRNRNKKAS